MDRRIAIQFRDARNEIGLGRFRRELELDRMQPEFAAHLVLRTHISARGGIVADQDDRKPRRDPLRLERGDFAAQFQVNFFRHHAAVDQFHRISTSCIIASCKRRRSRSYSSSVKVGATRCGGPKITRTVEKGFGRMKRSQLLTRQQLDTPC